MDNLSITAIWSFLTWLPNFILRRIFTKDRLSDLMLIDMRPRHDYCSVNLGETASYDLWIEFRNLSPFDVEIRRAVINVRSVRWRTEGDVGYIRVVSFSEKVAPGIDSAMEDIRGQLGKNLAGIVLDLRNNPGGFFNTSITIASEFFKKGIVVSQKGKVQTQDFRARGKARLVGMPVVVLVNKGSASASEIVAGALKDNIGAKLVGEQTFGKGTVQDRRELSNGGGVHITIGRWLMPEGEWIHDEGIPVDVEVKGDYETEEDEVLLKGIEEL